MNANLPYITETRISSDLPPVLVDELTLWEESNSVYQVNSKSLLLQNPPAWQPSHLFNFNDSYSDEKIDFEQYLDISQFDDTSFFPYDDEEELVYHVSPAPSNIPDLTPDSSPFSIASSALATPEFGVYLPEFEPWSPRLGIATMSRSSSDDGEGDHSSLPVTPEFGICLADLEPLSPSIDVGDDHVSQYSGSDEDLDLFHDDSSSEDELFIQPRRSCTLEPSTSVSQMPCTSLKRRRDATPFSRSQSPRAKESVEAETRNLYSDDDNSDYVPITRKTKKRRTGLIKAPTTASTKKVTKAKRRRACERRTNVDHSKARSGGETCRYCNSPFTRAYDARRHEQLSCSRRPREVAANCGCPICHKEFSRPDACRRHVRDSHGED